MEPSMIFGVGIALAMFAIFYWIWWREGPRVYKARAMVEGGALLVDVDDPASFAREHIEGAKNIPLAELARRASELGGLDQPIVVYGRGKLRAARAANELRAIGFHDVLNIGRAHW